MRSSQGRGGVIIGNETLFASYTTIIAAEHIYKDPDVAIWKQGSYYKPVIIGSDCWFGIHTTILQGTTIGDHCVIGAGSVVKGNYPDHCVIAGNPARIVKRYDGNLKMWK